MKRLIQTLIELQFRFSSFTPDPCQRKVNAKISHNLNRWIAEKGFCSPDATLPNVAREFGVSEEELSYYFSTIVCSRFSSLRKTLRLEEARRLINENPKRTLISVANSVGILDKCNFRKQFYQAYGMPPSEWQRQCAEAKKTG